MSDAPYVPKYLTVVFEDRFETRMRIIHENEHVPYGKRTLRIELTVGQRESLKPRKVGVESGVDQYEDIRECWFEPSEPARKL